MAFTTEEEKEIKEQIKQGWHSNSMETALMLLREAGVIPFRNERTNMPHWGNHPLYKGFRYGSEYLELERKLRSVWESRKGDPMRETWAYTRSCLVDAIKHPYESKDPFKEWLDRLNEQRQKRSDIDGEVLKGFLGEVFDVHSDDKHDAQFALPVPFTCAVRRTYDPGRMRNGSLLLIEETKPRRKEGCLIIEDLFCLALPEFDNLFSRRVADSGKRTRANVFTLVNKNPEVKATSRRSESVRSTLAGQGYGSVGYREQKERSAYIGYGRGFSGEILNTWKILPIRVTENLHGESSGLEWLRRRMEDRELIERLWMDALYLEFEFAKDDLDYLTTVYRNSKHHKRIEFCG